MADIDTPTRPANDASQQADQAAELAPGSKLRKCMMCKTEFPSGWSGERICRKCKSSNTWRST